MNNKNKKQTIPYARRRAKDPRRRMIILRLRNQNQMILWKEL